MAQWLRQLEPGDWYDSFGDLFEIIGVDLQTEIVLVQHFDGALEEIEFESWVAMEAVPCAPPEDPSGALDAERTDLAPDDLPTVLDDAELRRLYTD